MYSHLKPPRRPTLKINFPSELAYRLCTSAAMVLLFCSTTLGADITWTGSSGSFQTGSNWDTGVVPGNEDFAFIPSGTVNISNVTADVRGIRQTGGTINISGDNAVLEAGQTNQFSQFDGTVMQSGGLASINSVVIGDSAGSSGAYTVNGGDFAIARSLRNRPSLKLGGTTSGTGSMTVAGGSFTTRSAVELGRSEDSAGSTGDGTFTVLGSLASSIRIGNNGGEGRWFQSAGSSLVIRTDAGGSTPISLGEQDTVNSAVFESGAILDVAHLTGGGGGGGTWTVLEVQNGIIDDQGLVFAPGVDTDIWSFDVDNSGANGKLTVTAAGDPVGFELIVGNDLQQKMRFGMDYERLWFWNSGFSESQKAELATWSAVDTRIDYIRVAMNSAYELDEGDIDLRAYSNKIFPMMHAMQDANPDIKFFASPRPLNEAIGGAAWQPYPRWVTGDDGTGDFDFNVDNCVRYIEDYLLLMDSNGFKISFMDLTNEWQSNDGRGDRLTQAEARDVTQGLKSSTRLADAGIQVPLFIGPSSWNYSQGASWIANLDTQARRDAIDIASSHNTNRTGTDTQFANAVRNRFSGANDTMPEIWNTEVHGWKSTSNENETTSFYYMLENINAGFSGLNGWLAIGQPNQGHAYIINENGRHRNVKYFIFRKLSETSNYGHALNVIVEPSQLSHTAALIRGNLMTVWVINQGDGAVPLNIVPGGRSIAESSIRRTRWTDPADVEGFVTHETSVDATGTHFYSTVPSQSVCCFEILLEPEVGSIQVTQAEDDDARSGMANEQSGDEDGSLNLANINNGTWARYNDIALVEDASTRFRVARPSGRADGWVEVYLAAPGTSTATMLAGKPAGKVAVPVTGNWQTYETIEALTEAPAGTYDVVLRFAEVGSTGGSALFNLNWFAVESPDPAAMGEAKIAYGGSSQFEEDEFAPDKIALRPGQTASSANYTNYVNGLNRVAFDIAGMRSRTLDASDFEFRVGSSADSSNWEVLSPTSSVPLPTISVDGPVAGVSRVMLSWPDNAIRNAWLQVVVLDNENTGLGSPETFCFGNAVGETGNDGTTRVNLADVGLTRISQSGFSTVGMDSVYDFNRDGRVNLTDISICRTNQTGFTSLPLITLPATQ